MDTDQILLTAGVGLAASVVTAWVTNVFTRRQERRKHERDVVARLAELNSSESSVTRVMAAQYAVACLVVERSGSAERDRIFIPMGCRITLGRGPENHIIIDDPAVSLMHAAFRARGPATYVEPLAPTNGLLFNGEVVSEPRKLSNGDVVSVPGASFRATFVALLGTV